MPKGAPDVVGHAEVCAILSVSRQGLDHVKAKAGDSFPPATKLKSGPIWYRKAIIEWKRENR